MERPWWKCPRGRASLPLWSSLSLAARGLLATFDDAANINIGDPEPIDLPAGGLDAYLETIAGRRGLKTARAALAELDAAGWFTVEGDALVVHRHPVRRGRSESPVAPSRRRSEDSLRSERHYFSRRERAFKSFPPGLTWDAYIATPEGVAYLNGAAPRPPASLPSHGVATEPATLPATLPATHGTPANTGTLDVAGGEIEREERETHTTRVRAHAREGDSQEPEPGEASEVDPGAVIDAINERSQGRLKLQTYGDARPLRVFGDAVRAAVAGGVSVDLIERIGEHAAHGGFAWRTKVPLSLDVIAKDLSSILHTIDACPDCNGLPDERDDDIENERRRREAPDMWDIAIRKEAERNSLWSALVAGSGGRIFGATEKIHDVIEKALHAAKMSHDEARRLGAFACNPKAWAQTCRDIDRERAPTLQELAGFNNAALAACISKFREVEEYNERQLQRARAEQEKARADKERAAHAQAAREAATQGRPLFAAFLDGAKFATAPTAEHAAAIDAVLSAERLDAADARSVGDMTAGYGWIKSHRANEGTPRRPVLPSLAELTANDCAELRAAIDRRRAIARATG